MLSFPCMRAGEAGHVRESVAAFAGFACKSSNTLPFVSAVGAKSAENGKALITRDYPLIFFHARMAWYSGSSHKTRLIRTVVSYVVLV